MLDANNGDFGASILSFCQRFSHWRIGLLQGTKDVILTKLFREISINDYRTRLLGESGPQELTLDPSDNCSAWIVESYMHMFLYFDSTLDYEVEGKSAKDFASDLIHAREGEALPSYPKAAFTM
ncbi:MAG: hypothetical protein HQK52_08950 [Oligoflexia bacterium]|nr:hypothetical protein [Oligoflexia bacterium]